MDKKRLARIVKEEVQNLFEMYGRRGMGGPRRPAAPFGYGMGPYDSTKGKPEIDPFEAGEGDYRPRRPAGPPSLMGAGLSRTQGELFVIPRTGLLNIRLYPDNLDAVGGAVESKLFQMPEGITVRIVNFKNQSEVEGTLEVKSVSEESRNVLKGYEAKIKMGGTEFFGEGQRAADAIAAADDARAAGSAGGAEMGPGSMEPMSESRWGQLAGLMTEGKRSKVGTVRKGEAQKLFVDDEDGEPILYMGSADMSYSEAMEEKGKLRKVTPGQALSAMKGDPSMAAEASGTDDRDEIMGHLKDLAGDRKEAGKLRRGVRPMPEPAAVDEGSGAAPGSDPKRLPKPPNPKKDGPPGHEDLDAIKKLGPFERKKR